MKSVTINGQIRPETGKKAAKAIRNAGQIPCVLYGGSENIAFTADARDFKQLVYTPEVFAVELNLDGKSYKAVMQEVQFHPIQDQIMHADFLQLIEDKAVKVDLPVALEGTAAGVLAGGKMILKSRKLKVKGMPANLPEKITVNVENVEVGGTVKVKDLAVEGIEFLNSPNTVIATVKGKRVDTSAAAAEPAAEKK